MDTYEFFLKGTEVITPGIDFEAKVTLLNPGGNADSAKWQVWAIPSRTVTLGRGQTYTEPAELFLIKAEYLGRRDTNWKLGRPQDKDVEMYRATLLERVETGRQWKRIRQEMLEKANKLFIDDLTGKAYLEDQERQKAKIMEIEESPTITGQAFGEFELTFRFTGFAADLQKNIDVLQELGKLVARMAENNPTFEKLLEMTSQPEIKHLLAGGWEIK